MAAIGEVKVPECGEISDAVSSLETLVDGSYDSLFQLSTRLGRVLAPEGLIEESNTCPPPAKCELGGRIVEVCHKLRALNDRVGDLISRCEV